MRTPQWGLFCSLIFFCFTPTPAYALDLGDGSDGNCVWNGISVTARLWQCLDLDITGANSVPSSADILDVRVQGTVTITGSLSADASGANRGPGGFNGGLGAAGSDGQNGLGPTGSNGQGGQGVTELSGTDDCDGAGGSGGLHSGNSAPVQGQDATGNNAANCTPDPGAGGGAPTTTYGDPSNFRNQIRGGAGGGAGGSSDSNASSTLQAGGDGGGGGGVIRIYAGGDIIFDPPSPTQSLTANGADGGNGLAAGGSTAYAGGGGGGAGGAIYLVSLSQIEFTTTDANLSAAGGSGGTTPDPGGDGSNGDSGYISLEDSDGSIPGASTAASPSPSVSSSVPSSGTNTQLPLESDISPGCAVREINNWKVNLVFLIFFVTWFTLGKLTRSFKVNNASLKSRGRSSV